MKVQVGCLEVLCDTGARSAVSPKFFDTEFPCLAKTENAETTFLDYKATLLSLPRLMLGVRLLEILIIRPVVTCSRLKLAD